MSNHESAATDRWLRSYYLVRGGFSVVWVVAALTIGARWQVAADVLLLIYPAWDALANVADARRNGGLRRNRIQAFNAAVSSLTTVAVAFALAVSINAVLGVFGIWAVLSGLLQLATGVRRWKSVGAQWLMVISGVQSAAAGALFLQKAWAPQVPGAADIAPYAAFGAFYFVVSGVWLTVALTRRGREARHADVTGDAAGPLKSPVPEHLRRSHGVACCPWRRHTTFRSPVNLLGPERPDDHRALRRRARSVAPPGRR